MKITVKLNSALKRYTENPDGKIIVTVDEGATVRQVLDKIPIIKGEEEVVILNSKIVREDAVLRDGDVLELYPVMGGG